MNFLTSLIYSSQSYRLNQQQQQQQQPQQLQTQPQHQPLVDDVEAAAIPSTSQRLDPSRRRTANSTSAVSLVNDDQQNLHMDGDGEIKVAVIPKPPSSSNRVQTVKPLQTCSNTNSNSNNNLNPVAATTNKKGVAEIRLIHP